MLPPPRLNARYRLGEGTFAGPHGNGRAAPITAVRATPIELVKPTLSGHPPGMRIALGAHGGCLHHQATGAPCEIEFEIDDFRGVIPLGFGAHPH
jgi:hypothetical protein